LDFIGWILSHYALTPGPSPDYEEGRHCQLKFCSPFPLPCTWEREGTGMGEGIGL